MLHIAYKVDLLYNGELAKSDAIELENILNKVFYSALKRCTADGYNTDSLSTHDIDDLKQESMLIAYRRFTEKSALCISMDDFVFYQKRELVAYMKRHIRKYQSTKFNGWDKLYLDDQSYEFYQTIADVSHDDRNASMALYEKVESSHMKTKDVKRIESMVEHMENVGPLTGTQRNEIKRIVKRYNLKGRKGDKGE